MDVILDQLGSFLQLAVKYGTSILFGTLGGIICEKAGHLNLGVEGMMLLGAVFGYITAIRTDNPLLAILIAGFAGLCGALIYAVITVTFMGNQTVTGLVLAIFGTGFSNFVGGKMPTSASIPSGGNVAKAVSYFEIPVLSKIPVIGKMLFSGTIFIYLGIAIGILMWLYIYKTKPGLNLRMVGESPSSADASGINVSLYKYLHILAGGFFCGIGGAYFSLVVSPTWQSGMTSGYGWIAVALVIFSTWNPIKAIFGAYLFGSLLQMQFTLQNFSFPIIGKIPTQLLGTLPYLMTIVVLVIVAVKKKRENQPPSWLGIPYFREDR